MNKHLCLLLSIIIHIGLLTLIIHVPKNDEQKIDKLEISQIKITLIQIQEEIKNTNDSKDETIEKNKKYFLGEKDNNFKKNRTTPYSGVFKKNQKTKEISFKDLSPEGLFKIQKQSSPDHSPDEEFSDVVEFNTIRYRYYSFFKRIQDRLYNNWIPNSHNFKSNLITSVYATINEKGELLQIKVINSSNNHKFDLLAVQAFTKSSPYTNPPKDLIQKGRFSFEWKFIFTYN